MTNVMEKTQVNPILAQWAEQQLYYYEAYTSDGYDTTPEHGQELYMGNLRPVSHGCPKDGPYFIMPDIMTYGDYGGSLVEKANNVWMRENWMGESVRDDSDPVDEPLTPHVHGVYGGHGSDAIAINVTDICDECATELAEILESLDDYPLLDEELHSELEYEAQNEAWESWVAWDFARELSRVSGLDIERDETFDGPLWALLVELMEEQNEYWVTEGINAWVDLERIVGGEAPRHSGRWLAVVQASKDANTTGG